MTSDASKAQLVTADPRVASCIRFDHRQSIHPPSTSLECNSRKERSSLQRQGEARGPATAKANPLRARLRTLQDSLTRREMTQSSIKGAYSRGKQTWSAQASFQPPQTHIIEEDLLGTLRGHPSNRRATLKVPFNPLSTW